MVSAMRWIHPPPDGNQAADIARQLGTSPVFARLLSARNFPSFSHIESFLSPNLKNLADPLAPGQMKAAVGRLEQALKNQESVLIFGDYDVDGVTSTTLLTLFLRRFGLNPRYVVPRRLDEGYGLGLDSLSRAMADSKPDLLIAVDCGTSSATEVAWLREQGVSVLILDHHTSKESLPTDCILVNPHVHDAPDAPWLQLCAVGLVFKFCHAFLKVMREKGDPLAARTDLREFLDLVALGTVADLVPLEGENRILVRHGLRYLRNCRRPGICALMEVVGLPLGGELTTVDIGFRLGPRINASGRLDDATLPIQLLLADDWQTCRTAARMLDDFNRERQEIERTITEEAEAMVLARYPDDTGLLVHADNWHAGVVGIVASRLSRKFNRPAIVLGTEADGLCKGSGRSVPGVNLVEILSECTTHIDQWGGHPMAVGLTTTQDQLDSFRAAFNSSLRAKFPNGLPQQSLRIDVALQPDDLTAGLLEELDQLAPFGQGNPEPVFALQGIRLEGVNPLGNSHHRFFLPRTNGAAPIEGVAWNPRQTPPSGELIDAAIQFQWNAWRGNRSPRLTLLDWQPAGSGSLQADG
jgi:single-stranded-DNA-specific exonuclease